MDLGSQPTTSSANSQRIYNLLFEQFAQVLTLPDLSQFRFVFSGHYYLQYSYSTAKRTRDFFKMIVRYINVLLLLLLLFGNFTMISYQVPFNMRSWLLPLCVRHSASLFCWQPPSFSWLPTLLHVVTLSAVYWHDDAASKCLSTRRSTIGDRAFPVAVARAWKPSTYCYSFS